MSTRQSKNTTNMHMQKAWHTSRFVYAHRQGQIVHTFSFFPSQIGAVLNYWLRYKEHHFYKGKANLGLVCCTRSITETSVEVWQLHCRWREHWLLLRTDRPYQFAMHPAVWLALKTSTGNRSLANLAATLQYMQASFHYTTILHYS